MAVVDSELLVIGFIDRPDANDIEGEEPEFLIFNSETASRRVTGEVFARQQSLLRVGADLHFPDNDQQADACAAGQPENHILINAVEFSCRKGADRGADAAEHPRPAKLKPEARLTLSM